MKLELKHITPYLPYGLKGKSSSGNFFYMDVNYNMLGSGIEKRSIETWISDEYKPILHPISDIVKEIELNGEKFVPIIELAKISDSDFNIVDSTKTKYGLFGVKYYDKDNELIVFAYHSDIHSFAISFCDNNYILIAGHQLECFQKLAEWHIDIFGLIDAGLAIDINTIIK